MADIKGRFEVRVQVQNIGHYFVIELLNRILRYWLASIGFPLGPIAIISVPWIFVLLFQHPMKDAKAHLYGPEFRTVM